MTIARYAFGLMMLGLGCSANGDDEETASEPKEIGEACSTDDDCSSQNCAPAGVCTRSCSAHSQCGCTTPTSCGKACVSDFCVKVCESSLECAGDTSCLGTTGTYDACL